jgi:hypothetical protein
MSAFSFKSSGFFNSGEFYTSLISTGEILVNLFALRHVVAELSEEAEDDRLSGYKFYVSPHS